MKVTLLSGRFAVCRMPPGSGLPVWWEGAGLCSATRTAHELSIVCPEESVPQDVRCERNWSALELEGPIPFETAGVLASLASAIAGAGISLFAVSTFDTDYVLVKADRLPAAVLALREAGYTVAADI